MALEDFLEPEVAVTAVVAAAVFSPRARRLIRRGAVYGMAGALIAGDAIASFARNVGQGIQEAGASAATAARSATDQAKTTASTTEASAASAAQKKATHQTKASAEGSGG